MKKIFRPIYKKEELLLLDNEFLANIICRQEREIHELYEENQDILKEWKESIKSL